MQYSSTYDVKCAPDDNKALAMSARKAKLTEARRLLSRISKRKDGKSQQEADELRAEIRDLETRPIV